MNREIKFRGEILSAVSMKSSYIYGTPIFDFSHEGSVAIHERGTKKIRNVVPMSLAEYTGFKDKEKNEIYEGDQIEYTVGRDAGTRYTVLFNTSHGSWEANGENGKMLVTGFHNCVIVDKK